MLAEFEALFFLEAYEILFDTKTNTEKRYPLIKIPHSNDNNGKSSFFAVVSILENLGQKPPEIVRFNNLDEFNALIKMIKQASVNFDDQGNIRPNVSHLFVKIHVWMEGRFQTLTIGDLAGTCP